MTGLCWGPQEGRKVLALHGWMDHAASFQELAPRLTGCHVVALDLSGQGLSSHRSPDATYNIWDDLPQIAEILDQLGWRDCVLIGHSRGANIAALFAAALPEKVRGFVALDSLAPEPNEASVAATLRAFVQQTRTQKNRQPRVFETQESYVDRRCAQGNSRHTSQALAERALKKTPDGYQMRGDPRLFASSAIKLTQQDVEDVLRAIQCPVLNIWATDGIKSNRPKVEELMQLGEAVIENYERRDYPGDHHFHLDPDTAQQIAAAVLDFLDRTQ
ncbi:MAG: alpha/beta hydrolase [Pseudopelagicola sp.]|nr:alpha/beta hydrolase [Pseudopelagicola sp.]